MESMTTGAWSFGLGIPGGGWAGAGLFALLLVVCFLAWRALGSERDPRRRRILLIARVVTATLIFLAAAQPRWTAERVQRIPGRLALVFDASRSLTIGRREGESRRREASALASRWLDEADPPPHSVHRLGRSVDGIALAELKDEYPADADQTRIVGGLGELLEADAERALGAVVLISDGADTSGSARETDLAALGVPVHTVALGSEQEITDDAIVRVEADAVAFLRQSARVRVTLRAVGGERRTLPLTLRKNGSVVREVMVEVPAGEEVAVEIPFTPERLGRAVYQVTIPLAPEDAVPENNERAFLVRVQRDRLRVLLVAGEPSWDVRFLRRFLKRDPSIDLVSFFILRTTSDLTMAGSSELALIPFPTDELFREHLGSFDVVVFQNFEFGPYQMAPYLVRIRDYVLRGGSFAMVGGERAFASGGYSRTPVAEILPVALPPAETASTRALVTGRFRPRLVDSSLSHPLVAFLPDEGANRATWERLAPLEGANLLLGPRGGGRVLLEHPRSRSGAQALPILTVGAAGRGRVMALGSDTSWRWGMTTAGETGDGSAYERFWDRSLRWLARDPSLDASKISTDRPRYARGGAMRVEVLLRDDGYAPEAERALRVSLLDQAGRELETSELLTDAEGRAHAELVAPEHPGGYRVTLLAEGELSARAEEGFVVEEGGDELADARPSPEFLRGLSEATGGVHHASASTAPALEDFEATRSRSMGLVEVAPMASPWAFFFVVAVLLGEWGLRRRWGRS